MLACETSAQSVGGWGYHRPAEERGQYRPAEWEGLLQLVSVGGAATGLLRRGASTGLLREGLVQPGGGWEGLLLSSKSATSEAGARRAEISVEVIGYDVV